MKPIIKSTFQVTNRTETDQFLERVFSLFATYTKQRIIVSICTESNALVLNQFEIRGNFDFDFVRDVFRRNTNNVVFICTVEVVGNELAKT